MFAKKVVQSCRQHQCNPPSDLNAPPNRERCDLSARSTSQLKLIICILINEINSTGLALAERLYWRFLWREQWQKRSRRLGEAAIISRAQNRSSCPTGCLCYKICWRSSHFQFVCAKNSGHSSSRVFGTWPLIYHIRGHFNPTTSTQRAKLVRSYDMITRWREVELTETALQQKKLQPKNDVGGIKLRWTKNQINNSCWGTSGAGDIIPLKRKRKIDWFAVPTIVKS
jgi:hypothetical protein